MDVFGKTEVSQWLSVEYLHCLNKQTRFQGGTLTFMKSFRY